VDQSKFSAGFSDGVVRSFDMRMTRSALSTVRLSPLSSAPVHSLYTLPQSDILLAATRDGEVFFSCLPNSSYLSLKSLSVSLYLYAVFSLEVFPTLAPVLTRLRALLH
jgi:hypothetical protein